MLETRGLWTAFPWFLLRGTGFPFGWFEALGAKPVWDVVDEGEWAARVEEARSALQTLVQRPLFREAVFTSNPTFEEFFPNCLKNLSERRTKVSRKQERTLLRYAQRFCAKNDTTSFFGALAAGRFDRIDPLEPYPIATERRVFVTQWAVA